jgi:hypothetical protein
LVSAPLDVSTTPRGSRRQTQLVTRAETRAETEQRLCKICDFATKIFDSNKRFCWLKRASLG